MIDPYNATLTNAEEYSGSILRGTKDVGWVSGAVACVGVESGRHAEIKKTIISTPIFGVQGLILCPFSYK